MSETFYADAESPVTNNAADGVPITVGTYMTFGVAGQITHARWFFPVGVSSIGAVGIVYRTSDSHEMGRVTFAGTPAQNAWVEQAYATPIDVASGVQYAVCVWVPTQTYVATGAYFASSITRGDITAPAQAGRFDETGASASGPSLPTSAFNNGGYFADCRFVPSGGGTDLAVSGTFSGTGTLTGTVSANRTVAGAFTGHGTFTGTASGGDAPAPQDGTAYEIEEIMDALAATFDGVETGDVVGGVPITLECRAEVMGQVQPPSIVLELEDLSWDLNMGHGADGFTVVALALVTYQDVENSQRALWRFLSRKQSSGILRLKAALEANQTLGGLVSYAVMGSVRNIGIINYDGVNYLGAELIIGVVS